MAGIQDNLLRHVVAGYRLQVSGIKVFSLKLETCNLQLRIGTSPEA
jgi:hypothetical protein